MSADQLYIVTVENKMNIRNKEIEGNIVYLMVVV
jgi:hypothetical protein